MTKLMARFKPLTAAAATAIAVSACSSVPQDGVVSTHLGGALINGSMSQMWSNIFTGELRRAPQPEYAFGGSDATLNTPQLMNRLYASRQVAGQIAHQQYYQAQYSQNAPTPQMQNYVPPQKYTHTMDRPYISQEHSRIQPRLAPSPVHTTPEQHLQYQTESYPPQMPQEIERLETQGKKRSFGSRLRSIFKSAPDENYNQGKWGGYENTGPSASAPLPSQAAVPQLRPAKSQPVLAEPQITREAYPAQTRSTNLAPQTFIEDNPPKSASYSPAVDQDWQAASQETGDSLSYVKMGGGSKISDWQACEKQAGNYFIPTSSGFTVAPKFDSCMRAAGYMPEAEAQATLNVLAG